MELRYQIPDHLVGFIGNIPEPQLNALITMLFEYAIQHRMLEYPRTEIENSVDEIRRLVVDMKSKQSLESSLVLNLLASMNAQMVTLSHIVSGGQMPPMLPQIMSYPPAYGQVNNQHAASVQDQPIIKEEVVLRMTEEDLLVEQTSELGKSGDETQDAFEADLFK